jgi:hypothetical protein
VLRSRLRNLVPRTTVVIGYVDPVGPAAAIAHEQPPMSADADECPARSDVAELTIELATPRSRRSAGARRLLCHERDRQLVGLADDSHGDERLICSDGIGVARDDRVVSVTRDASAYRLRCCLSANVTCS